MSGVLEQKTTPNRYSKNNPPASLEIAHERLQTVDKEIGDVEAQLQHANPNLYLDPERFNDWRRRATSVVGFLRSEKQFLERWIEERELAKLSPVLLEIRKDQMVVSLSAFVDDQVKIYRKRYEERYGQHLPVPTFEEATARRGELLPIWNDCTAVLKTIQNRGDAARLSPGQKEKIRKPLGIISMQIQTEISFLKKVLSADPVVRKERVDWTSLLLSLVERAKTEGFVTTPEEDAVVQAILDHRKAAGETK